jgi:uncharacterized protein DUF992
MIRKFASVLAASLAAAFLAVPANAGVFKLGLLTCDIDGGTALVIASHKGLNCTFKPSRGGYQEHYTGVVSKLGVDLGATHQGSLVWAVLAITPDYEPGRLTGNYLGATAEASVVTGGGANLLVGGFQRSFSLQPLSVQGQTGVNVALAVTSMRLYHSLK